MAWWWSLATQAAGSGPGARGRGHPYSKLWGPRKAAKVWGLCVALAFGLALWAGSYTRLGWLRVGLLMVMAPAVLLQLPRFLNAMDAASAKRVETASGLWTLFAYGWLGLAPFLLVKARTRLWLDPWSNDALHLQQCGGKALALGRLAGGGRRRCRGFIVVTARAQAYDAYAGLAEPPADFLASLRAGLAAAGLDQGFLAVRSSALSEDGAKASYAGQFESVLAVHPQNLAAALQQVWASGSRSARVEAYRAGPRRRARPHGRGDPGLGGRRGLPGVAFTADPVSHRGDVVVISAVLGLGEGLVGGELNADPQRVSGGVVGKHFGAQGPGPAPASRRRHRLPSQWTRVPAEARPALEPSRGLGSWPRASRPWERTLGRPQDLEWALDGERKPCVLQARPITTLGGELRIWDNANIVESYAGVTLSPHVFVRARGL